MSRVLIIVSHPIPYVVPLFQEMVARGWDFQVAYCDRVGLEAYQDVDFGQTIAWDVPLLAGYPSVFVPNRSHRPGLGRFWGLVNPRLWPMVAEFDVVICFTGYVYASFWWAALSAKWHRRPFIFSTDASSLGSRFGGGWKGWMKPLILPWLYRVGDALFAASQAGVELLAGLGIERDRIFFTPFVVDNAGWLAQAAAVDRAQVRASWGIPDDAPVVIFCAKLQPWKRPQDVLAAFLAADVPESYLLFVGDGTLRAELATTAQGCDRVRFLGFCNQSQLPAIYTAADLLCLGSDYEPFGVVVNEAMLCGCGVVVSDRVGARELVNPGVTGEIYPCGDRTTLAAIFRDLLTDPARLHQMGQAARDRMTHWSPRENVANQEQAIQHVMAQLKSGFNPP
ncbi:glycosyltransferase family 4 protein [Spirulina major CS-329]|jgi:glycosyltransferase involved in cell wall biosynthesis|uniref:glycosyltransferase family 4 protein n=1 Tax=Spirulina TaxID=1154 RepID=UPI0023301285|nr:MULTISPECIES: glycosyltransferase family 4 protein [Spirulina]MDB9493008.1 glycosyltransferase family 4 protein [Spirulina subsalsa CS-330]MDB9505228.1 glycosyltransferase family 4 protein [Spirulina major CS-329]